VAALVAVNAMGDVLDHRSRRLLAGLRSADGGQLRSSLDAMLAGDLPEPLRAGLATTIGVIGTDAQLDKAQAQRLALMAHDGLARSIDPIHTLSDGDTLYALATGRSGRTPHLTVLGALAAEVTARAVANAVWMAESLRAPGLPELPCARELADPADP
jgi:L-aminopeptidase/D-esterase-like protein